MLLMDIYVFHYTSCKLPHVEFEIVHLNQDGVNVVVQTLEVNLYRNNESDTYYFS